MKTYLIYSNSYKIIDTEIKKIVKDSLNVIKYDLRVNSLSEAINEVNYYSLTNDEKFIIVKCGNLLKSFGKEETANKDLLLLEKYLESPSEINTLILVCSESPDKRKKVYKLLQNSGKVIINEIASKKDLVYKCMDILKEKKYRIDYNVANDIVENSYNNYDIMLNELEKIYILIKPCNLTIELLEDVISKSLNNNIYSYINAIMHRDIKNACEASKDFETLKIDSTMVLIMLAKEFENLYLIKSHSNLREVQQLIKKEDWQMNNYVQNKDLFTLDELKKIIIKLNDYDYKVKSGLLDKSILLDLVSLDLCE